MSAPEDLAARLRRLRREGGHAPAASRDAPELPVWLTRSLGRRERRTDEGHERWWSTEAPRALETVATLGPADAEMASRLMETAQRHGHRMNEIVDDLLTLSKIEAEGDVIQRAPVSVMSTIRPAASAVAAMTTSRNTVTRMASNSGSNAANALRSRRMRQAR